MNVIARQVSVASGKIPANPWGALNKSTERVADKIGMIIRRATKVVAGTTCQGAQRHGSQRAAREAPQSGDRAAKGMLRPLQGLVGAFAPAAGSHLPLEDTAPPYAVAPFALSPFAHPIPQSHRRASDLFSASLMAYERLRRNEILFAGYENVAAIFPSPLA
jgi:hypothetical protein